ncbi:transcriptional regulator BetI [Ochrobactrum sp. SFR4]|uniref:transcriptional regulator BetI n=1 Tax=Ochrobactrum sp. SFR4 TaxID=2717368 RepID=UPI001C8BFE25|nr:transcriptional regulator BetI [Ochrobactrum sp. SFR4]MBX8824516.1 transcriptional regulator BetI [Ochrobactrum sp. SFR4]
MPKIGMEELRRKDLISAAIQTIGERGSLDVTVAQIARKAGVSAALAHHYFGGKDQLLLATMRHLLSELGSDLRLALQAADSPRARLSAIISVNFSASQFAHETIAAWLTFYAHAKQSLEMRRLLRIYARRLHSNLSFALEQLTDKQTAQHIAEGTGALIDGLYIRHALGADAPEAPKAIALVEDYITVQLVQNPPKAVSNQH